ncbi:MAG TPA: hypothetical protein VLJ86_06915 [Ramlibacter sp.]|nr:hypothetical protein [Ramlibacter sp.]
MCAIDNFTFVGVDTDFTASAQVRAVTVAGGWLVQGTFDNNQSADFAIFVVDPTHTAITFDATDFILT